MTVQECFKKTLAHNIVDIVTIPTQQSNIIAPPNG